jgi:uncharacterized SAM-binding protein YcdF (DUF218 family)
LILKLLVEIFVLPPFNLIVLAAIGLVVLRWRRRAGIITVSAALVLLYAFSTPLISGFLSRSVRGHEAPMILADEASDAQAIVILGAGKYLNAPEYFGDTIRGHALERVRYGAFLHRRTGKPILVSGGDPRRSGSTEAELMRAVLETELGVSVTWSEGASDNTFESAQNSWSVLSQEGIEAIYLVTHANHMARAQGVFEQAGFQVTPAPTIFLGSRDLRVLDFLPRANAMTASTRALKELIGRAWYAIRY